MRINRNIVECKLHLLSSLSGFTFELIETLWNVNKLAYEEKSKRDEEN